MFSIITSCNNSTNSPIKSDVLNEKEFLSTIISNRTSPDTLKQIDLQTSLFCNCYNNSQDTLENAYKRFILCTELMDRQLFDRAYYDPLVFGLIYLKNKEAICYSSALILTEDEIPIVESENANYCDFEEYEFWLAFEIRRNYNLSVDKYINASVRLLDKPW
ncbi:MAG: hypothetical protein HUJ25_00075 [Crocinitomicaceae bacterium]|nr:hypothetical protein [Crocinitomicaceae bacterium]